MARVAWFTPIPPVRSGIAQYNRELLPSLANDHQIDVFVDGRPDEFDAPGSGIQVYNAVDFVWRVRQRPYDLNVYQLGNATCHDYMWAYLFRYPGLVVLHDGQLHHARARLLLQQRREDDYRREFRFNHPDADPDVAELGVARCLGSLNYVWPMLRTVVESSRMVVVHNPWLADDIRRSYPEVQVRHIDMGIPEPNVRPDAGKVVRARHGIPKDSVLFTAFGKVTPEKRVAEVVRSLAALSANGSGSRLLLAGETVDYYDPLQEAKALGVEQRIAIAGYVRDEEIDDYLSAADVCLCMRWPSSRETSASWLRCMAAGRPTITTDLAHTVDIPTLDSRSWEVLTTGMVGEELKPVGVSVNILDEQHSLTLAMSRLAADARMRTWLGGNGRDLWNDRFRLERMTAGYLDAISAALALPVSSSRAQIPSHLLDDGTTYSMRLLREAGVAAAIKHNLWKGETP